MDPKPRTTGFSVVEKLGMGASGTPGFDRDGDIRGDHQLAPPIETAPVCEAEDEQLV